MIDFVQVADKPSKLEEIEDESTIRCPAVVTVGYVFFYGCNASQSANLEL